MNIYVYIGARIFLYFVCENGLTSTEIPAKAKTPSIQYLSFTTILQLKKTISWRND